MYVCICNITTYFPVESLIKFQVNISMQIHHVIMLIAHGCIVYINESCANIKRDLFY